MKKKKQVDIREVFVSSDKLCFWLNFSPSSIYFFLSHTYTLLLPFLPSSGTQSLPSLLPNLPFFPPSNYLHHFLHLSLPHLSASWLSGCLIDLGASEPVLSAVGIMAISWVARLFIFVPNEVRFSFRHSNGLYGYPALGYQIPSCFKCLIMGCTFPRVS